MRITSVVKKTPKKARCISVDSEDRLFAAGGESGCAVLTHNSVCQRNIIFSCIMRPDTWRFIGIDLKRVELSAFNDYKNVVLGIATELEGALESLRFAQGKMMKRYENMERASVNNFEDLPDHLPHIMVMVDEAGELLSSSGKGGGSDEAKRIAELKAEAQIIIGSIARLGRAAGVHLVIATQRPDADLIPGETKANLSVRINAGHTDSTASSMILGSGEGLRVKSNPKGRLYIALNGDGDHGQGFFAPQSWIDDYLRNKGLNKDGTPIDGSNDGTSISESKEEEESVVEQVAEESTISVNENGDAVFYADDEAPEEEDNESSDDGLPKTDESGRLIFTSKSQGEDAGLTEDSQGNFFDLVSKNNSATA